MSGFTSPNHTQVPNDLFDKLLPLMSETELKVVLHALRQTLGFHRGSDAISISQFMKGTGLSRQGVVDGLNQAKERGLICEIMRGKRGVIVYGLVYSVDQSTQETSSSQGSRLVKRRATGQRSRHTKETSTSTNKVEKEKLEEQTQPTLLETQQPQSAVALAPNPVSPLPSPKKRFTLALYAGQDIYADGHFISPENGFKAFLDDCNSIFYAWLDALAALKRKPDTSLDDLWSKHRDAVKALAAHRRTPEQVAEFVRYAYSDQYPDDFYRRMPAPITLAAISGAISGWLSQANHRNGSHAALPVVPPAQALTADEIAERQQIRARILEGQKS